MLRIICRKNLIKVNLLLLLRLMISSTATAKDPLLDGGKDRGICGVDGRLPRSFCISSTPMTTRSDCALPRRDVGAERHVRTTPGGPSVPRTSQATSGRSREEAQGVLWPLLSSCSSRRKARTQ